MRRVGTGPLFKAKGHWYDPFLTGLGATLFALAGCFIGWQLVAAATSHHKVALGLAALAMLAGVIVGAYVGTVVRQAQAPHERTRARLTAAFAALAAGLLCWGAFSARRARAAASLPPAGLADAGRPRA